MRKFLLTSPHYINLAQKAAVVWLVPNGHVPVRTSNALHIRRNSGSQNPNRQANNIYYNLGLIMLVHRKAWIPKISLWEWNTLFYSWWVKFLGRISLSWLRYCNNHLPDTAEVCVTQYTYQAWKTLSCLVESCYVVILQHLKPDH